jgi:hypothetical protein
MGHSQFQYAVVVTVALACAACTGFGGKDRAVPDSAAGRSASRFFTPLRTFQGSRLADQVDAVGAPRITGAQQFETFLYPASVAARGLDLYIADTGRRSIFRLDTVSQTMAILPHVNPRPGTRLRVAGDATVYVLDPASASIRRFDRSGRLLNVIADSLNLAHPVDFALDEMRGRIFAADGAFQQLLAFHPAGRASQVILSSNDFEGQLRSIAGIAVGSAGIYLSDPACGCLAEFSPERASLVTFGHGEVRQPGQMALDRWGRLYVADASDGSLKLFRQRRLAGSVPAAALGVMAITGFAVDEGFLYVADGPGSRVAVLRITPPGSGEE